MTQAIVKDMSICCLPLVHLWPSGQRFHQLQDKATGRTAGSVVTTASQESSSLGCATIAAKDLEAELVADQVLEFLRGRGPAGKHGRTLEVVLGWDFQKLEEVHDFIQWLFPTDERSRAHPEAPVLTPRAIAVARDDATILANVLRGLDTFLRFLGLEWAPGCSDDLQLRKLRVSQGFEARWPVAWDITCVEGNHNWKRVSRALMCLRLFGLDAELEAFYLQLERLWACGRIPRMAFAALQRWQFISGFGHRALPKHGSSRGVRHGIKKLIGALSCGVAAAGE